MKNFIDIQTKKTPSLFSKKEEYLLNHDERGHHYVFHNMSQTQQKKLTYNNKHLSMGMQYTIENGIPIMSPYNGSVDFDACRFDKRWTSTATVRPAIHFFIEDYLFYSAVTVNLEKTTYKLIDYNILFAPDNTLYVGGNKHENLHAIYVSRFAGAYW